MIGHLALVLGEEGVETIVVTRHPSLIVYLKSKGMIPEGTKIISHVNAPEEIRGKHVVGILPLHWASIADRVTELPLDLPPEARGKELSVEEVTRFARTPRTYRVTRLDGQGIEPSVWKELRKRPRGWYSDKQHPTRRSEEEFEYRHDRRRTPIEDQMAIQSLEKARKDDYDAIELILSHEFEAGIDKLREVFRASMIAVMLAKNEDIKRMAKQSAQGAAKDIQTYKGMTAADVQYLSGLGHDPIRDLRQSMVDEVMDVVTRIQTAKDLVGQARSMRPFQPGPHYATATAGVLVQAGVSASIALRKAQGLDNESLERAAQEVSDEIHDLYEVVKNDPDLIIGHEG